MRRVKKFSEFVADNLKAKTYDYDVIESDGFVLRVYKSGKKAWCILYTFDDTRKRFTFGKYPAMGIAKAREEYYKLRRKIDNGVDPKEEAKRLKRERKLAPSVNDFIGEYIKDYAKVKKRTWEADEQMLIKNVSPEIGNLKLKDVTRRDVALILKEVMARGAQRQANKVLAVTRKMFNYAVDQGLIEHSPCDRMEPPGEEKACERALSDAEIRAFWYDLPKTNMPQNYINALRLILVTCMRPGEAGGVIGEEIKGRWATIDASRMKNKRPHRVYLTDLAIDITGENPASGPLFVGPKSGHALTADNLDGSLKHYLECLDCKPFTPHDLRRTVSSKMGELEIPPLHIDKVLSHLDQTVRGKHYDIYAYDKQKKAALELWAAHLSKILNKEASKGKVIRLF